MAVDCIHCFSLRFSIRSLECIAFIFVNVLLVSLSPCLICIPGKPENFKVGTELGGWGAAALSLVKASCTQLSAGVRQSLQASSPRPANTACCGVQ